MDCVNYFKIESINAVYIAGILRELFKKRFKEESGGISEWKNSYGKFILKEFGTIEEITQTFDINEIENIANGNLEHILFTSLLKLLVYSKYKQIDKKKLDEENTILKFLSDSYSRHNTLDYELDDKLYILLKNTLIKYSNKLSSNRDNKDIDYLLDTLQLDSKKNINQLNKESETKANELKEIGNQYHSKENYKEASKCYKDALQLPNLSNYTKSVLNLNMSTAMYYMLQPAPAEEGEDPVLNSFALVKDDYLLLMYSLSVSKDAIRFRPSWSKAYYRSGYLYSRTSNYSLAIKFYEAALALDSSEENTKTINTQLNYCKFKEHVIAKSLLSNGQRDYEKETKLMLDMEYGYNKIIKSTFKEKLDVDKTIEMLNQAIGPHMKKYQSYGLPRKKTLEYILASKDIGACSCCSEHMNHMFTKRLIADGTELAFPYYEIAIETDCPNFKMTMMLKATTLPVPFYQPKDPKHLHKFFNYKVASACEYVGVAYLYGLLGNDVDLDRARYYFEKSISIDKKLSNKELDLVGCSGFSYLLLGHIYNNGSFGPKGYTADTKSKSKAIEIWNQGIKIGTTILHNELLQALKSNQKPSK